MVTVSFLHDTRRFFDRELDEDLKLLRSFYHNSPYDEVVKAEIDSIAVEALPPLKDFLAMDCHSPSLSPLPFRLDRHGTTHHSTEPSNDPNPHTPVPNSPSPDATSQVPVCTSAVGGQATKSFIALRPPVKLVSAGRFAKDEVDIVPQDERKVQMDYKELVFHTYKEMTRMFKVAQSAPPSSGCIANPRSKVICGGGLMPQESADYYSLMGETALAAGGTYLNKSVFCSTCKKWLPTDQFTERQINFFKDPSAYKGASCKHCTGPLAMATSKLCGVCQQDKPRDQFSKVQWKRRHNKPICIACIMMYKTEGVDISNVPSQFTIPTAAGPKKIANIVEANTFQLDIDESGSDGDLSD
jgi:hypothetical protein